MKTIFHFNCVICGAQPGEKKIKEFAWPFPPDREKCLLNGLQWIFTQIINGTRNEKLRQSIEKIKEAIPKEYVATPLHDFEYSATMFIKECPLCGTHPGERQYDQYFHAWSAWDQVCGVQIGNLLYEMWFLFGRTSNLSYLVPLFNAAIDTLSILRCKCGRPTSALGGLCRWCYDIKNKIFYDDIAYDEKQELLSFLNNLKDIDLLGVGKEEWEDIRLAIIRDNTESYHRFYLPRVLMCYPVNKWLEPWRSLMYKENCWPTEWIKDTIKNPPPTPQGLESNWHLCRNLPLEVFKTLYTYTGRSGCIPPVIEEILQKRGLLIYGQSNDISGYLSRFSIKELREISNRLGAGNGRSKEEIIGKITHNISPAQVSTVIPGILKPWIKEIRLPSKYLPEEWVEYTGCTAPLIENFIREKYRSWLTLQKYRRESIQYYIEINSDCPSYCKEQAEKASLDTTTSLEQLQPWFPGCGCTVGINGASNKDEAKLKKITIGSVIELKKDSFGFDSVDLKPFGLHGQLSRSSNGKYSLIHYEGYDEWHGWYILIEKKQVIAFGRICRPMKGKVANNGAFIIDDCGSGRKLGGRFWAINRNGEVIIRRTCTANILELCVSSDGRFAACYFGISDTADSNTIIIFNLKDGSKISQFMPETIDAGVTKLRIDSDNQILLITDIDKKIFRYSFDGTLLDKQTWEQHKFDKTNGYELITKVEYELENETSSEELKKCADLLQLALTKGVSEYYQGIAYSLLGQIHEEEKNIEEAVMMYETALKHYPKLPIKRKLKELKNR